MAIRAKPVPTDPRTHFQSIVRAHHASLVNRWIEVLTQDQRDTWNTYATNVNLPNRLGQPCNVGGLPMFIRSNMPRRLHGFSDRAIAPTTYDLGEFTPVTGLVAIAFIQRFYFMFNPDDAWCHEHGAAMTVYASRPRNPTICFHARRYRNAGTIRGRGLNPPRPIVFIDAPFRVATGQRIFVRVAVIRPDGRLSGSQQLTALVT